MELIVASSIGVLTTSGVYLMMRARSFTVIMGLSLLSYAVNIFIFAVGRLAPLSPPIITENATVYTDPLPQALVLTAIVISFGMTAVILLMALASYLQTGSETGEEDGLPR